MSSCPFCGQSFQLSLSRLQKQIHGTWAFLACTSCGEKSVITGPRSEHRPVFASAPRAPTRSPWVMRAGIGLALLPIAGAGAILFKSAQTSARLPAALSATTAQAPAPVAAQPVTVAATVPPVEVIHVAAAAPARQLLRIKPTRAVLRSGPGTQFTPIGSAEHGQLVEWIGEREGWYHLSFPAATEAWVRADLAEKESL